MHAQTHPPDLVAARAIVGAQRPQALLQMVRALRIHRWNNTADDERRLHAAELILKARQHGAMA